MHLLQLAVDLSSDFHRVGGLHRAQAAHIDRNIAARRNRDGHGNCSTRRSAAAARGLPLRPKPIAATASRDDGKERREQHPTTFGRTANLNCAHRITPVGMCTDAASTADATECRSASLCACESDPGPRSNNVRRWVARALGRLCLAMGAGSSGRYCQVIPVRPAAAVAMQTTPPAAKPPNECWRKSRKGRQARNGSTDWQERLERSPLRPVRKTSEPPRWRSQRSRHAGARMTTQSG